LQTRERWMQPPSDLQVVSCLIYPPRPINEASLCAKSFLLERIKVDRRVAGLDSEPAIDFAVRRFVEFVTDHNEELLAILQQAHSLVPMPGHALRQDDSLWIPLRIAEALANNGIGQQVSPVLRRSTPVPKSALARPGERPSVRRHFETMEFINQIGFAPPILLVDDVVTRGATLLGAAARLIESGVASSVPIRAFALARSCDVELSHTRDMLDPIAERLVYDGNSSIRCP